MQFCSYIQCTECLAWQSFLQLYFWQISRLHGYLQVIYNSRLICIDHWSIQRSAMINVIIRQHRLSYIKIHKATKHVCYFCMQWISLLGTYNNSWDIKSNFQSCEDNTRHKLGFFTSKLEWPLWAYNIILEAFLPISYIKKNWP